MSTPKWLRKRPRIAGSLRRLAVWVIILSTWEGAYRVIGWKDWVFPAPSHVLDSLLNLVSVRTSFGSPVGANWPWGSGPAPAGQPPWYSGPLVEAVLTSGARLLVGFGFSLLLGMTLGLAMWRWEELDRFLGPLFLGMQTLPSVCWAPLAVLTFGLNEVGVLFVLVMGSFFAIAIALRDGLRSIPPLYQRAGMMMGASGWRLYRYVLLPASLPAMTSSLRQGFSFAWRSLMGAELVIVVQRHGLGFLLEAGRTNVDVAQVVAMLVVMVFIGMLADRWVFARLQQRVNARFGLSAAR